MELCSRPCFVGLGCAVSANLIVSAPVVAEAACLPMSGAIDVTVVDSEPVRVLGVVTGTLAGATQATVLAQEPAEDGVIRLDVTHDFVTDDRSAPTTEDEVIWTPVSGREGFFEMQTTYTFVAGTGRFADATGTFQNQREVDTRNGLVTVTYQGELCGVD